MDGNKKHTIPRKVNPPRQLERDKSEAWLVYKRVRYEKDRRHDDTLVAWNRFKECNKTGKQYELNSQIQYEKSCVVELQSNSKIFYSYIKYKKVCRSTAGPIRATEGIITDDPKSMTNCFADVFLTAFTDTVRPNPAVQKSCNS